MNQEQLPVFLTHEGGDVTISYLTVALMQDYKGVLSFHISQHPKEPDTDDRPVVVRENVSLQHCLDLVMATISGRLVRDLQRRGRCP